MDDTTILGATLGQLGQTAKKTVQQVVNLPEEKPAASVASNVASGEPKKNKPAWTSDDERVKFLRELYGSDKNANPVKDKSPEEQKKMIELRNQLHKENYYDPTFNPVTKQEERPAEKVENEKKEEMAELAKKEDKKPQPLAVVREQNKAEQFRGAAG